ncbi:hypothetical protein ABAC460_16800 [Asticcacaulis sp. AC460]|nr:hypothetical protein ABAC460_16800 [Asticcacaulis sp. AC460]
MLDIRNFTYFPDTRDALDQVEQAFGDASANAPTRLSRIGNLVVSIRLSNPLAGDQHPGRGSYDKPTGTYYIAANADYDRWVVPDWHHRTQSYAAAMKDAIGRVAKTRLPEAERTAILGLIDHLEETVSGSPPDNLKPLKPVKLMYSEDSLRPAIAFDVEPPIGLAVSTDAILVLPQNVAAVAASLPKREPESPRPFKLYRRDGEALHYQEAWAHDGELTEHWGVCGHEGDSLLHHYDSLTAGNKIVEAIKRRARQAGFSSLPRSRHRQLVIELPIDGFGAEDDIDVRHKLQTYFDNCLGWLGLGHVDGGSTGSGSMEIFCIVPDVATARIAVLAELPKLKIDNARLYEMK